MFAQHSPGLELNSPNLWEPLQALAGSDEDGNREALCHHILQAITAKKGKGQAKAGA